MGDERVGEGAPDRGPSRAGASLPWLHVVTDDAVLARATWPDVAEAVLEAGGPAVALHLRGPRTLGRTLFALARRLVPRARATGSLLIVNDRVDVALAAGADGAHLGARSLPPADARRLLGTGRWMGVSLHDPDAVGGRAVEGADYAFLGTIHRTPSHPEADTLGAEALRVAARRAGRLPVLGIGGIRPEHVRALQVAGAHGVAVMRGVWSQPSAADAVRAYLGLEEAAPPAGRSH